MEKGEMEKWRRGDRGLGVKRKKGAACGRRFFA
jgi:hypothetical protein